MSVRSGQQAALLQRFATALAVVVLIVPAGAVLVRHSSIERTISRQWHSFVRLSNPTGDLGTSGAGARSRLLSGGGYRYDYWRVAW